MPNASKERIFL